MAGNRGRVALLLVTLASAGTVAACDEQSRVDADAPVRIEGAAVRPDGAPLTNRPVRLGSGVGTGEGAFAVLTLGLGCAGGGCTGDVHDTSTDDRGAYAFDLKGRQTQSNLGEALSFLVTTSAAPAPGQLSGASTSARFRVQTEVVRLPALQLVDPGLALEGDDDVTARWAPSRRGPYEVTFEGTHELPVWRATVGEPLVHLDGRILEGTSGRAVVSGGVEDAIEGSEVMIRWRSPGIPYVSAVGAPPSRGRPCHYLDAGGQVADERRCDLTDGDLTGAASAPFVCPAPPAAPAPTTSTVCQRPVAVVIDLGRTVPGELVVVRGCEEACPVDVSADGRTFQPAGAATGDFSAVALDGRPLAAVRIGLGRPLDDDLREVSVWGQRPQAPVLRVIGESETDRLRRPFVGDDGDDDGVSTALVVAAAVLVAFLLVVIGFTLGRRRQRSLP